MPQLKENKQATFDKQFFDIQLTEAILKNATIYGYDEYRATNRVLEGPTSPGTQMYHKTNKALREQLLPLGWTTNDKENILRTVSPNQSMSIVVCKGDAATGYLDQPLCIKNEKGNAGKRGVDLNKQQCFPFYEKSLGVKQHIATYYLVHYIDEANKEVRFELSLPVGTDEKNRANEWKERYTFSAIQFDDLEFSVDLDDKFQDVEDFEVQIKVNE